MEPPYDERRIEADPLSVSVFKRPGMYFGDMEDGQGYSMIIGEIVSTLLSWRTGANLTVRLRCDNVVIACRARLPDAEIPDLCEARKPFLVYGDGLATLGRGWFCHGLGAHSLACRNALWELRDAHGEQSSVFSEGLCHSASFSAPKLPDDLCFRVSLSIGTERLPLGTATLAQVAKQIRYMSGPAEAGYWGCVTIWDERIGESQVVIVTDPPPRD